MSLKKIMQTMQNALPFQRIPEISVYVNTTRIKGGKNGTKNTPKTKKDALKASFSFLEREKGFEPSTSTLGRSRSTN